MDRSVEKRHYSQLSFLHPVRSLRILLVSPAFKLDNRNLRFKTIQAVILALLVVAVWTLTRLYLAGLSSAEGGEAVAINSLMVVAVIGVRGLVALGIMILAFVVGLRSFALEKQAGTMDQLLTMPISRTELVLARLLARSWPLAPAVLLAVVTDMGALALAKNRAFVASLSQCAWMSVLLAGLVVLLLVVGLLCSLARKDTAGMLVAHLPVAALIGYCVAAASMDNANLFMMILGVAASLLVAVPAMVWCIKRLDKMMLRESPSERQAAAEALKKIKAAQEKDK